MPTPPLPLATATTRRTPGMGRCWAKGLWAPRGLRAGLVDFNVDGWTPGKLLRTRSQSDLSWLATSGLAEASWSVTLTGPSCAAIP